MFFFSPKRVRGEGGILGKELHLTYYSQHSLLTGWTAQQSKAVQTDWFYEFVKRCLHTGSQAEVSTRPDQSTLIFEYNYNPS